MTRWILGTVVAWGALAIACGSSSDDAAFSGSGGAAGASGGSAGSGAAGAGGVGGSAAAGGSGGSGATSSGCGANLATGDQVITLEHDGNTREYTLHVPPSYDASTPLPLVLNFHGLGSNMDQQIAFSAMNATADARGAIVAYPNGLQNPGGTTQSWNAGVCCAFGDTTRDDLGFARALVADIATRACIDPKRVYSTGMSNGGYMSHYLACKAADVFAAVAPVAGQLGIAASECQPSRPVPIIHFHGTEDTLVPYDGGQGVPSVPQTMAGWAERNGCDATPTESYNVGAAHCDTYPNCNAGAEVTLCTIDGMGHCWPGQAFCPPNLGSPSTDISANEAMFDLFEQHALP